MIILGIDPGSRLTGYGVINVIGNRSVHIDNGTIDTRKHKDFNQRLLVVHQEMTRLVTHFSPDIIAVESIFYAKNVQTALKLGHARGAAIVAALTKGRPLFEYSPLQVKQAVVGFGKASKDQVTQMVKRLLALPEIAEENASDALAVALCHAHSAPLNKLKMEALA